MYLSRMALNPQRRGTRRFLADPQVMHAAVMGAFPPGPDTAGPGHDGRILWRLDAEDHELLLWVVSPERPSFDAIREQAGWSAQPTDVTRPYDGFMGRLAVGQPYAFRLTANPVHTVTDEKGRKRRLGHVTVAQQEQWLLERCGRMGVEIRRSSSADGAPDLVVHDRRTVTFRRGDGTVTLRRATYDGVCTVQEPHLLREALTNGVGRAKGYGCGLMTLAMIQG